MGALKGEGQFNGGGSSGINKSTSFSRRHILLALSGELLRGFKFGTDFALMKRFRRRDGSFELFDLRNSSGAYVMMKT